MKLSRTKLSLFHRFHSDRLIVIRPDGLKGRVCNYYEGIAGACYCTNFFRDADDDHWSKFPSPEAALKAMRKYEKENGLPEAEFVGEL